MKPLFLVLLLVDPGSSFVVNRSSPSRARKPSFLDAAVPGGAYLDSLALEETVQSPNSMPGAAYLDGLSSVGTAESSSESNLEESSSAILEAQREYQEVLNKENTMLAEARQRALLASRLQLHAKEIAQKKAREEELTAQELDQARARQQPQSPDREKQLQAKYASMDLEERAFSILVDLGMIEVTEPME